MTVDFDEAVSGLAASLIGARRTLDAASASLVHLYGADDTLRSLPVPSYTLAEATFDVPFVVEEVVTSAEVELPQLPRRPVVKVGTTERASLLRGVDETRQERLDVLLEQFTAVQELYARAQQDPRSLEKVQVPDLPRPTAEDLAQLRTGASKTARDKLDRVLQDAAVLRGTLLEAQESVRKSTAPRLRVRLDAEALEGAGAERVHRVQLTFRDQRFTTVDVDDTPVSVPE